MIAAPHLPADLRAATSIESVREVLRQLPGCFDLPFAGFGVY
jgi:hypothetical protein